MATKLSGKNYNYIVEIREVFDDNQYPNHFFIVMEYCNYTSLFQQIYLKGAKIEFTVG
jgi:serine/threonine protein kinase